ncbi:MAG: Gfo/Idh/MocA family oxidoreductase [Mycobacteriales bacterium]
MTARVVLVGHGLAGRTFHEPFLRSTPGLDLVGIVRSGDVSTMWDFRPDLVVLATPNDTHVPLALEAVRRGVAVVVDKPLGLTVDDASELVLLAESEAVPLGVFHNRRWDGDFRTAQQLLSSGALGDLVLWESRFERWRPAVGDPVKEAARGGVLLDLGPHLVDQALVAVGPVASVHAVVRAVRPGAVFDDDVQITLRHRSGAQSLLVISAVASQLGPRFRLLGTSASWVKHGLDGQEALLREGRAVVEDGGRLGSDDAFEQLAPRPGDWGGFYAGVAACLAEGGPMPVTGREGLEVLRVLDAARESGRTGEVVRLG